MTTRTSLLLGASFVLLAACSGHSRSFSGEPEPVSQQLAETEVDVGVAQPVAGEGTVTATPTLQDESAALDARAAKVQVQVMDALESRDSEDDFADAPPEEVLIPVAQRQQRASGRAVSSREKKADGGKRKDRAMDLDSVAAAEPMAAPAGPMAQTRAVSGSSAMPHGSGPVGGVVGGMVAPPPPDLAVDTPITTYGSTETYTDYGVNPYTMVMDDALSTFSIDVDTASYSIARKKLEAGVLPPPEAVRVEEFINYLDYGYGGPSSRSSAPFAVHMAAMPDPFRANRQILRVGVQAKEVSRDEREPVHLTFLVDVSGSMSSADKLPLAKQSMHMLVDSLREDDTVALATYAGRVARILQPTSAGDKQAIHGAIESLNSGGSTAMSSGIDLAYEMAWESFEKGHENRVIVMSDGDANVGRTSWDDMLTQIKGYADRGVTLSTIGLGMGNYQDTLMEQLSNKGDGNNYYIDDAEQAQRVFVEQLGGTMVTVARDVKIQVEFNDDSVTAYRLLGYENRDIADKDFRNDKVDAGEVGAGHNVTAVYEVIMADGYDRALATVRLRWEKPGADVDQGGSGGMERAYTFRDSDLAETTRMAPKSLRMAYATATFAEILRHSPAAQELSMDELIAFAKSSQRSGNADDAEVVALMEKARALGLSTTGGTFTRR